MKIDPSAARQAELEADVIYGQAKKESRSEELKEELKKIESDPTEAGTCWFDSMVDAVKYYRKQECDRAEVDRKLNDREMFIGRPPNAKRKDEDGRWMAYFGDHDQTKADIIFNDIKWKSAMRQRNYQLMLRDLYTRAGKAEIFSCGRMKKHRKAMIQDHWDPKWEGELDYCTVGQPFYNSIRLSEKEHEQGNTRILCFDDSPYELMICRKITGSTGIHWGMRNSRPERYLFSDGEFICQAQSMKEVLEKL